MIQIIFGWVGFHCNGGNVRGMANDADTCAKVYVLCLGVVSFLYWNLAGMRLVRRVLRMSVSDMAIIANIDETIRTRVELAIKQNNEVQQERVDYWHNRLFKHRKESEIAIDTAKARINELEFTVKTLLRMGNASND